MGRPRKYSDDEMIAALKKMRGMVYLAAEIVGCCADTIYHRSKTSPEVLEVMRFERGKVVDKAEQKLFDAIEAGEPWAIQMALKTLGKDRGYATEEKKPDSGAGIHAASNQQIVSDLANALRLAGGIPPAGVAVWPPPA